MADTLLDLGIEALPAPHGRLQAGRVHALTLPPALVQTVLLGVARQAVAARRKLVLLVDDPARLAAALVGEGVEVARLHQRGQLRLFAWQAVADVRRVGAAQWLDELDHFGVAEQATVVVCPAGRLFQGNRRALTRGAQLYAGWARLRRAALLWLFPAETLEADPGAELQHLAAPLAQCARITPGGGEWIWELRPGRAPLPPELVRVHRLRQSAEGRLVALEDDARVHAHWASRVAAAPDRDQVFCTAPAAGGLAATPPRWQVLPQAQDVERATAAATAAICVLDLSDLQAFRGLAHLVQRMRARNGRGLRVLVRECGVRLRQGQQQLLLALGANAIVPRDLESAQLPAWIESGAGEVFMRPLFNDFESAFVGALPPAEGGYQPVAEFTQLARRSTERARAGGLDCALLRFFVPAALPPVEALRHVRPVRPGDLCTADDVSVYLFLFGCWQEDIEAALERILRRGAEQLFDGQIRSVAAEAILAELDDLAHRHAARPLRDYRNFLRAALTEAAPEVQAPAPETTDARRSGRRLQPAPLRLRGEIAGA